MEKAQIDELLISFGWNYNQADRNYMYASLKNIRIDQDELTLKLVPAFDKKPVASTLVNKIWNIVQTNQKEKRKDCAYCENRGRIPAASIPFLEGLTNTEKMATIKPLPHGQLLSSLKCPFCSGMTDLEMYYSRYKECGDYDRYIIEYVWIWYHGVRMEELLSPNGRLMNNG